MACQKGGGGIEYELAREHEPIQSTSGLNGRNHFDRRNVIDVTDKLITPTQQIISSCFGAVTTSLVVKVRLQKQLGVGSPSSSSQSADLRQHTSCMTSLLKVRQNCKVIASDQKHNSNASRVTPLDVVKVRLQAQIKPFTQGSCFICSNGLMDHLYTCVRGTAMLANANNGHSVGCPWYARPSRHFTGTMDALVKIARFEGVTTLWSGLSPTLVMALPATIGYFFMYDNVRFALRQRWGNTVWAPVTAGALTRVVMVTCISPMEMVRTKLQSQQLHYYDVFRAIRVATREQGPRALWQGWVPMMWRDVPFSAIYWGIYELSKLRVMESLGRHDTNFVISFVCGAFSGTIAAGITLPFDVVKTHRQIAIGEQRSLAADINSNSTVKLLQHIYRTEGVHGLFAGFTPRIARVAPSCAIMIASYEYGKIFFSRLNQNKSTI